MPKKINQLESAISPDLNWFGVISDESGNARKITLTDLKQLIGIPITQLSTPDLIAITISSSQIDLTWDVVINADYYTLERSTNYVNWTQIGGTILNTETSYSDTSLNSLSIYYYRLKAIGDGILYSSSNFGEAEAATLPTESFATWYNILATQYEQYNSNKGVRKPLSPNTSLIDRVYSMESITEGYAFEFTIDNVVSNVFNSWLATSQTEVRTDSYFQINLNTSYKFQQLSNSTGLLDAYPSYPAAVGDRMIYMYKDGKISVGISKDAGDTYTILYRYNIVPGTSYFWTLTNGVAGYGCSEVIYRQALSLPPYKFTAIALSGNTSIYLSWEAVTGATSYTLERATDLNFTSNKTTVYTGTNLNYTNTGLSNSTTYYYRVKATVGLDTAWALYTTATSASGDKNYLTWTFTGTRNEYTADFKGIRRTIGFNAADANYSYTNESIVNGQAFVFSIDDLSANIFSVGINTTKTIDPASTSNFLRLLINTTLSVFEGATSVSSGNSLSVGNYLRISIISNVLKVEKSTNSGSTWSNVYTSALSPSGTYYLGYAQQFQSGNPISLAYKMTGL